MKRTPFQKIAIGSDSRSYEQANFWPSVSDILMVILMVFILGMVVMASDLKNLTVRLAQQVSASRDDAKRILSLHEKLGSTESEMKAEMTKSVAVVATAKQLLDAKDQELVALKVAKDALEEEKKTLYGQYQESLGSLEAQKAINTALAAETSAVKGQLATVQDQYERVRVRYEKLIKPARSPKGKRVAEVQYVKGQNGMVQLLFKAPGSKAMEPVSESKLHDSLAALQSVNQRNLYVKIVFPRGSEISHDEAWQFTNSLLQRYDYYYQED